MAVTVGKRIDVYGDLELLGEEDAPIRIHLALTPSNLSQRGWEGFRLVGGDHLARYTAIEGARRPFDLSDGGTLWIENAELSGRGLTLTLPASELGPGSPVAGVRAVQASGLTIQRTLIEGFRAPIAPTEPNPGAPVGFGVYALRTPMVAIVDSVGATPSSAAMSSTTTGV